ncbi:AAA family ATPase [Psychrobacter cibarius]|uniref:AAA family ATPase n=1 Tax=Psychrobacter cibarius TaxID=282669 RepID=UPI003FD2AF36
MEYYLMDVRPRNEQYTWIPAFKAIADWIADYEDRQPELVNTLVKIGIIKGLEDEHIENQKEELKEIDPFTFFAAFMKFGVKNRGKFVEELIKLIGLDITVPKDFDGVPTSQAQKFWLFPYEYLRSDDSIPLLWELFRQARNGDIKEQDFNSALKILGTGFTKLTQYLFYISPSQYLPIDAQTEPWLENKGFILPRENWSDYQKILTSLRAYTDKPFWQISYEAWFENSNRKVASQQSGYNIKSKSKESNMTNLNRILYGPPGTGKTYCTTELAVQCVAPDWYESLNNDKFKRQKIKDKYDELTAKKRIAFTTFHQSFSYEDFVEGIRANTNEEGQISYTVEAGIFKEVSERASRTVTRNNISGLSDAPKFWKISLGDSEQKELRRYCFSNGEARIGWGYTGDLNSDISERTEKELSYLEGLGSNDKSSIKVFSEKIQVGDVLFCLKNKNTVRAIGIVTSDYEFDTSFKGLAEFHHTRKVNWILQDINFDIYALNNNTNLTQKTCYKIDRFTWNDLAESLERQGYSLDSQSISDSAKDSNNHILIIDEINRGNISRIFGELITLLEPDKRKGGTDAREVILPYSKLPFSVPSNLYVLGTMNTADKSLAQLDLALRRRFDFIELLPKPELLDGITVHGIAVSEVLTVINQRIEVLLDREHTIGHSYFWSLKDLGSDDEKEIELGNIFKRRIIPLLQEYFFSDWERIGWVLNDPSKQTSEQFIQNGNISPAISELFDSSINGLNDRRYHINETAFNNPESYKKILIHPQSKSSDGKA